MSCHGEPKKKNHHDNHSISQKSNSHHSHGSHNHSSHNRHEHSHGSLHMILMVAILVIALAYTFFK